VEGAAAIAVITEWEQFKALDWQKVHASMQKPAFVFDGRNILDGAMLRKIGFVGIRSASLWTHGSLPCNLVVHAMVR